MHVGPKEVWDSVAVLTLFDAVNRVGAVDGNLKAQKIVFLAEVEGQKQSIKTAHFRFFRYTYGPFSRFLVDRVDELERIGFLTAGHVLTKRGQYFRDFAKQSYLHSGDAIHAEEVMRSVARKYGKHTGTELKELVYQMRVPVIDRDNHPMRVKDISTGTDIIDPDRDLGMRDVAPFDEEALEGLVAEMQMDPKVLDPHSPSFQRTVADALKRVQTACS